MGLCRLLAPPFRPRPDLMPFCSTPPVLARFDGGFFVGSSLPPPFFPVPSSPPAATDGGAGLFRPPTLGTSTNETLPSPFGSSRTMAPRHLYASPDLHTGSPSLPLRTRWKDTVVLFASGPTSRKSVPWKRSLSPPSFCHILPRRCATASAEKFGPRVRHEVPLAVV